MKGVIKIIIVVVLILVFILSYVDFGALVRQPQPEFNGPNFPPSAEGPTSPPPEN